MELYATTAITVNWTGRPVVRAEHSFRDYVDHSLMIPARDGSWLAVDIFPDRIYVLEMEN